MAAINKEKTASRILYDRFGVNTTFDQREALVELERVTGRKENWTNVNQRLRRMAQMGQAIEMSYHKAKEGTAAKGVQNVFRTYRLTEEANVLTLHEVTKGEDTKWNTTPLEVALLHPSTPWIPKNKVKRAQIRSSTD